MLRMIGYMNLVYEGGQKDDFTEALQKLYRNFTEIDRKK